MRFVTFQQGDTGARPGVVVGDQVIDLTEVAPDLLTLIQMGDDGLRQARERADAAENAVALADVRLLAPIPRPRKNIMCVGMNYVAHAYESARARGKPETLPPHPVYFTKAVTAVNHPDGTIPFDGSVSEEIDWEVELALVLGRTGKNIPEAEALDYVWGYTIINDVSARDIQDRHLQFFKGKSLDGTCPMGPMIVTADEIGDPHNLRLTLRVNGETKQDSNTNDLVFNIPTLLAVLSRGMTLEAGDILATGTPSGVGMGQTPPSYLRPGDVVEAEIEKIGVLRNRVEGA
jgi:2-keto-4-pentenoate hydratase/2-oxohepta-3-ene-1,7-dioic acid hydratase in catechol pathway